MTRLLFYLVLIALNVPILAEPANNIIRKEYGGKYDMPNHIALRSLSSTMAGISKQDYGFAVGHVQSEMGFDVNEASQFLDYLVDVNDRIEALKKNAQIAQYCAGGKRRVVGEGISKAMNQAEDEALVLYERLYPQLRQEISAENLPKFEAWLEEWKWGSSYMIVDHEKSISDEVSTAKAIKHIDTVCIDEGAIQ